MPALFQNQRHKPLHIPSIQREVPVAVRPEEVAAGELVGVFEEIDQGEGEGGHVVDIGEAVAVEIAQGRDGRGGQLERQAVAASPDAQILPRHPLAASPAASLLPIPNTRRASTAAK